MTTIPTCGLGRPAVSRLANATRRTSGGQWDDLGQPGAIASSIQPPVSRMILQLQPYGGRIFLGYGEWNIGLDTCDLIAWNPATLRFDTVASAIATDAFWTLRTVGQELWALVTDPAVGTDPDAVALSPEGVRLIASPAIPAWHLFDVCNWAGSIYLGGASRDGELSRGCVWRSDDGGVSWQTTLTLPENERIYALFTIDDVTLHAVGMLGETWATSNGTAWTRLATDLLPIESECVRPVLVAGQVVYLGGWAANGPQNVYSFDGRTVRSIGEPWSVLDVIAHGATLLVLTSDGQIRQTTDLIEWITVTETVPHAAQSLCQSNNYLYVGTRDSHLWRRAVNPA